MSEKLVADIYKTHLLFKIDFCGTAAAPPGTCVPLSPGIMICSLIASYTLHSLPFINFSVLQKESNRVLL